MDTGTIGRITIGALALVVCGFALHAIANVGLSAESAIALLGTAAGVLLLSVVGRGRGNGDR